VKILQSHYNAKSKMPNLHFIWHCPHEEVYVCLIFLFSSKGNKTWYDLNIKSKTPSVHTNQIKIACHYRAQTHKTFCWYQFGFWDKVWVKWIMVPPTVPQWLKWYSVEVYTL
jgi:hypothetical protein